jgi:hypothetical protein
MRIVAGLAGCPILFAQVAKRVGNGIIDALATSITSGVSQKSQAGDNREIPSLQK